MTVDSNNEKLVKQSFSVLALKLIFLEILLVIFYVAILAVAAYLQSAFSTGLFELVDISVILFILFTVFQLFITLFVTIRWAHEEYFVGEDYIRIKKGLIYTQEENIQLENIEKLVCKRGLLDSLLGTGSIVLENPRIKPNLEKKKKTA
jgi:membrane protein YdbS with pleckstrin-like domain